MTSAPPPRSAAARRAAAARLISPRTLAWEDRTAWPMFVLSIVFFVASVTYLASAAPSGVSMPMLAGIIVTTWLAFIVDYIIRMVLSGSPKAFLRTRWFEGVSLAVPYLRPFVILVYIWRLPWFRKAPGRQRIRLVVLASMFTFLFVYAGSALVWLVEHTAPGANILHLGDAIWWGFATIATVGYGDYTPVTVPGRVIAVGLMMGGLVVLGMTSAIIVSTLNEQIQRAGERIRMERELHGHDAGNPAAVSADAPAPTPPLGNGPAVP